MSEYAPVMAVAPPATMMMMPAVAPQPRPQPKPQPQPNMVMMTSSSYGNKKMIGRSDTVTYKLAMTLIVVLGMGTWVWGSMKFHKCGSGWVVAILKQLGVSFAVSIGYAAAVFSIVNLIRIWNEKAGKKTGSTMSDPVVSGLTIAVLLIAVNMAIFREKCRL
jgi:hypothetical protein